MTVEATTNLMPVRVQPGEEVEYARSVGRNFYEGPSAELDRLWASERISKGDYRAWLVREGDTAVANYGAYTMDVSLPGGVRLPMAGVTAVGVAQTHRRRGLLSAMMRAGLDEAVERGEPVAMLYASESAIYGRYGFGVTAPSVSYTLDRRVALRDPVAASLVRPATPEEALAQWPAILEGVRDVRAGAALRDAAGWSMLIEQDPEASRGGFTEKRFVHVPGRGYAIYRVKDRYGSDALPDGEVRVLELLASDREADAALWQHVTDIDLTSKVHAWYRPSDDRLLAMLVDPLRARPRMSAPLYARLLDVAACFGSRAYASAGTVTFAVVDPSRDQSGTYHLDADPQGAEVRRTDHDPELTLPVDAAASVWLGGVRATQLLDAGRIDEHVPGAAARLDRLVTTDRAPWNPFEF